MKPLKVRKNKGPEAEIQEAIVAMLRVKQWHVMETHGNMYQSGFPDVFACHTMYGQRWIEVKNPKSYSFTPAQIIEFPKICANGSGVWILVAATEFEYAKLFKGYNWWEYLSIHKHGGGVG